MHSFLIFFSIQPRLGPKEGPLLHNLPPPPPPIKKVENGTSILSFKKKVSVTYNLSGSLSTEKKFLFSLI